MALTKLKLAFAVVITRIIRPAVVMILKEQARPGGLLCNNSRGARRGE
jgi:hypothetical protein